MAITKSQGKAQTNPLFLEHEAFKEMFASAIIFAIAVALVLANNAQTYPSYNSSTIDNSYGSYRPFNAVAPVPQNRKPSNASYLDDGCGDSSVRFKGDGYCYPLLKKGPCYSVLFWITVDPHTYEVGFLKIIMKCSCISSNMFVFFVFFVNLLGNMHSSPLWKRKSVRRSRWFLSRYFRH